MALLYKGVPSNPENGLRVRLGFNEETLSGTKVLNPQDAQFQMLGPKRCSSAGKHAASERFSGSVFQN